MYNFGIRSVLKKNSNSLNNINRKPEDYSRSESKTSIAQNNILKFHHACKYGDIKMIKQLLTDKSININEKNEYGKTALHFVSKHGYTEVIQLLLDNDADIDQKDCNGQTALHIASENGYTKVAQLLLDNDAHINIRDDKGNTAQDLAIHKKYLDIAKLISNKINQENSIDQKNNISRFCQACDRGDINTVRESLNNKSISLNKRAININEKDRYSLEIEHPIRKSETLYSSFSCLVICTDRVGQTALHIACMRGHVAIVKLILDLLDSNLKINEKDKYYGIALETASQCGYTEVVELLLNKNINIKQYNAALGNASKYGHIEVVKFLLDNIDINVNEKIYYQETALHAASKSRCVEIVKLLLNHNAEVFYEILYDASKYGYTEIVKVLLTSNNIAQVLIDHNLKNVERDSRIQTALHVASKNGHIETVKVLLANKYININEENGYFGNTALSVASEYGHTEIVKVLLANNDINEKDINKALSVASEYGHTEIVKVLLANNDINEKDINKALSVASKNGHVEIVKVLLANNDINEKDINKALSVASEYGHIEIIELLLNNNASLNEKNEYGKTALHAASKNGHVEIVKILSINNDGIDQKDENNQTALYIAIEKGHTEIVKILLDNNADIGRYGFTALYTAHKLGHIEIAELIEAKKAENEINIQNGWNYLHLASRTGDLDQVKFYLRNIDVESMDVHGNTALHFAVKNKNKGIITELIANNININRKNQVSGLKSAIVKLRTGSYDDKTALHLAVIHNNINAVEELLLAEDIKIDEQDSDGNTAIHLACLKENFAIVELLINKYIQQLNKTTDINDIINIETNNIIMKFFNNVLALYPKNIAALLGIGEVSRKLQDYEKAQKIFDRVIKLDAKNWWALERLAEIYRVTIPTTGKPYEEAVELFKKALAINPHSYWAIRRLAETYYSWAEELRSSAEAEDNTMSTYRDALEQYKKAAEYNPKNDSLRVMINNLEWLLKPISAKFVIANEDVIVRGALNEGSYAKVKHGQWTVNGHTIDVVVKTYKDDNQSVIAEFQHETNMFASLLNHPIDELDDLTANSTHPNIIKIYGVCYPSKINLLETNNYSHPQKYALILEYASQGSLNSILYNNKESEPNWETRYQFALGIAKGLEYLHMEKNIIHRDLNSNNIVVSKDNIAKITDFGFSANFRPSCSLQRSQFNSGHDGWRAPELDNKQTKYTKACDIFSFGVILWELVSGQKSYGCRGDTMGTIPKHTPKQYKKLIEACRNKNPNERPKIDEIVKRLEANKKKEGKLDPNIG